VITEARMRDRVLVLLASCAAGAAIAAPTALPGPAFPIYADAAALTASCSRHLDEAQAAVKKLERRRVDAGWLAAYDDLNALFEDRSGPFFLLTNVHPEAAMRDASEACELRWRGFFTALGQNETLYKAARRVQPRDAIDRELRKSALDVFEDAGVSLPTAQRTRAKAINDRIDQIGQTFDKNIRDDATKLAFTEGELKGVPDSVWKSAKRDDQERVVLGLDYPSAVPVMQLATTPASRERMWRAKQSEGGAENLKLLAEIAQLRREYAALFGKSSFADFTLRRRMAQDVPTVKRFLGEVQQAVGERERRELEELREAKARDLGQPLAQVKLERWDVSYYTERVKRERYSVDQEAFRTYFPPRESLAFVMRVVEKMMGVRYEPMPDAKLWHPDALAFRAVDVKSGRALAALYVDAYPRDGKYGHAAVWPIRSASARLKRAPQAALVVNFDRNGLSLDEVETLLHEFGHAVHNNFATARHATQGGGALPDFVEAPSQMLEAWVYDPKVVAVMREVCPACKPVPDDLLAKAKVAERYGKGVQYARQRLFASFDQELHGPDAPEPMALWERLEGATILGHVKGTMFPASFSHVATNGNYTAGYYGYLWSEVVAADLRTAFADNKLDAAVGRRYRDTILARGSEKPPQALVRDFLGRESNSKAFFEDLQR
jgi:thimet oligopeptidase